MELYFRFLSFCHRRVILHWLSNFVKIELPLAELWRHIIFSRWRPAAILYLIWIILDHPRSAIVGLRLVLKFGLDRIYSFGDCNFITLPFWLEIAYSLPFLGGVLGAYFTQMTSPIVLTPKGTFSRGNTSFKVVIFRLYGISPTVPIRTKICMVDSLPDVITLKFLGVTISILHGVEFPIFLLIFAWTLQLCAACDRYGLGRV